MTAARGAICLLVGAVLLRLTVSGTYERYVRPGMGPFLLVAGALVALLGVVGIVRALRGVDDGHAHGHDHAHGLGVGWLLLAPIAALLLVAPPTLGAYGVNRAGAIKVKPGKAFFKPLRRADAPVEMTLLEYVERAQEHKGASFRKVPVKLTGFVAGGEAGAFRLARYQIACCAADATPVVVEVAGTSGTPPSEDQWVTVTGTFQRGGGQLPRLFATSVAEIPAPNGPYE